MYKRVMVVDDNPVDLYIAEISIQKSGFSKTVILQDSAVDALAFLSANQQITQSLPELIFLDINMPEMNGFEFLESFEKLPAETLKGIEIIMLSSSLDPEDYKKIDENKFVSTLINKPLTKDKLKKLLPATDAAVI